MFIFNRKKRIEILMRQIKIFKIQNGRPLTKIERDVFLNKINRLDKYAIAILKKIAIEPLTSDELLLHLKTLDLDSITDKHKKSLHKQIKRIKGKDEEDHDLNEIYQLIPPNQMKRKLFINR